MSESSFSRNSIANSRSRTVMMRRCQKASAAIILIIEIAWIASCIKDIRSSRTTPSLVLILYSRRAKKKPGMAVNIKVESPNRPEMPVC